MKVKLCPLCDSEMKKAHYCDVCKSFIWRPEILDMHYNAQERGMGEEDCAYGEAHNENDHGTNLNNEKNKRKAGGWIGTILFAVIILNAIISSLGGELVHFFTELGGGQKIEDVLDEVGIDEVLSAFDDRSETEEALLTGTEDDYSEAEDISYFELTKEELEDVLSAWANAEYGSPIRKTSDDMEQECVYEDAEGDEYTVPAILSQYGMGNDQEFLMVYTGSEADDILAIDASFRNPERAYSFFSAIAMTLDPDSGYDDSDWADVLDDLMNQSMDGFDEQQGSGHGSMTVDDMRVSVSKYADGEIWLMFDAVDD